MACLGCDEPAARAPTGPEDPDEEAPGATGEAVELRFPEPPEGADPLEARLYELSRSYARNMEPHGDAWAGELDRGQTADHQTVLEGSRCYKVLGVGGPDVDDLDLMIFDPNGVLVDQDDGTDEVPVLGLTTAVCPSQGGMFRVHVRMFRGRGAYRVQAARSEPSFF